MGLCSCRYHQLVLELLIIIQNNGQRGTVPLTESKTEMIHGLLSLGKLLFIHLVRASQSLSSSMQKFFSPLKPGMIENLRQKNRKHRANSEQERTSNRTSPGKSTGLPITRLVQIACFARSSMLPLAFANLSVVSQAPGKRRLVKYLVVVLRFTSTSA